MNSNPANPMRPMRRTVFKAVLAAALTGGTFGAAVAQKPKLDGPLTIVVGYAPGGSTDRAARLLGQAMQEKYGTNVVVENKPGAGGRMAAQHFINTGANDNVLLFANPAIIVIGPLVFKQVEYNAEADFVPVAQVTSYDFGVAVSNDVPVKTVGELVTWLKANPQKSFFGVPATGSLPHFFALMVGEQAGVKAEVVGYKGSAPLMNAIMGGEIPVAVDPMDTLAPLHKGGKLKLIAVSGRARSPLAPEVSTLTEGGIDLAATGWNTLFAAKSMPAAKVQMLSDAVKTVMADPAVQKRFTDAGMEPVSLGQAETASMLKAYKAQWEPVVKRSGYQQ